jgi:hypothetical protein
VIGMAAILTLSGALLGRPVTAQETK